MTSTLAMARPLRDRGLDEHGVDERRESARHLEIAATRSQRRARPRVVYALIVVGGIGVILLAQLLLSIVLADGAYRISALQVQQRDAGRERAALDERLDILRSTQSLTTKAEALGMVASGNPVFLDAANGQVTGTGSEAGGSLVGSGNLIGNSLLAGDGIDPEADAAAAASGATATPTTEEDGGIAIDGDTGATDGGAAAGGATAGGTITGGTGAPTGSGTAPSLPSAPGVIASPVTR